MRCILIIFRILYMRGRLLNNLFNVAVEIFCQSKIEFRGRVQYTYTSDALQTVKFLVKPQNF